MFKMLSEKAIINRQVLAALQVFGLFVNDNFLEWQQTHVLQEKDIHYHKC